jgi:hypothetical protein
VEERTKKTDANIMPCKGLPNPSCNGACAAAIKYDNVLTGTGASDETFTLRTLFWLVISMYLPRLE